MKLSHVIFASFFIAWCTQVSPCPVCTYKIVWTTEKASYFSTVSKTNRKAWFLFQRITNWNKTMKSIQIGTFAAYLLSTIIPSQGSYIYYKNGECVGSNRITAEAMIHVLHDSQEITINDYNVPCKLVHHQWLQWTMQVHHRWPQWTM